MLKDNIVCIGVGQCGGNYVSELESYKNQAFYVNTSLDDLDTIKTDHNKKYCIENTKGMAKDREYANETITSNENDEKIADLIFKKYSNAHSYFFFFGLSGGTGGGMSIQIMRKFKDFYPDKIVNAVTIYPNDEEDMLMQYNAYKCLEDLKKCLDEGIINNLQILNNNSKEFSEKFSINTEFTEMFEDVLSFNRISKNGNLDEEEMERLFTTNGITVIYKLSNEDVGNNLSKLEDNTIYAPFKMNPTTHGLILSENQNNSINRSLIKDAFGMPVVTHDIIWDNDYSIIISTGMTFNDGLIEHLKSNYNTLLAKKQELENSSKIENKDIISIDESALKSLNRKTTTTERPLTRSRRSREVGVRADTRYRR